MTRSALANAAALAVALALGGCGLTSTGDYLKDLAATKGREAAAEGLVISEWYLCRASPVGAIKDRYGRSRERAKSYANLCKEASSDFLFGEIPEKMP